MHSATSTQNKTTSLTQRLLLLALDKVVPVSIAGGIYLENEIFYIDSNLGIRYSSAHSTGISSVWNKS